MLGAPVQEGLPGGGVFEGMPLSEESIAFEKILPAAVSPASRKDLTHLGLQTRDFLRDKAPDQSGAQVQLLLIGQGQIVVVPLDILHRAGLAGDHLGIVDNLACQLGDIDPVFTGRLRKAKGQLQLIQLALFAFIAHAAMYGGRRNDFQTSSRSPNESATCCSCAGLRRRCPWREV